jgi:putative spermidine/putrescine transport system substrate-binding protein
MKRRQLLQSLGILALEPLLFGCQSKSMERLKIQFLKRSLPILLTSEFQKLVKSELDISTIAQLAESLELLTKWSKPAQPDQSWRWPWQSSPRRSAANLITLGDTWLSIAIEQKLIKPLNPSKIPTWPQLNPRWQQLVTRDGQVWGAPYRWGSTLLVYRRDKFRQQGIPVPTDWSALWRPELKGRISLLNQQQEIIGLTLKQLGHTYHTDPQTVPELPIKLRQLHQQTVFYSSDDYLSPLLAGDTWLAVAWSQDVAELINRFSHVGLAIPHSGTSLWADLWVQPQSAPVVTNSPTIEQWIDFCWQPPAAQKISQFTTGLSPMIGQRSSPGESEPTTEQFSPELMSHAGLNATVFAKGEFLQPLTAARQKADQALWQSLRT